MNTCDQPEVCSPSCLYTRVPTPCSSRCLLPLRRQQAASVVKDWRALRVARPEGSHWTPRRETHLGRACEAEETLLIGFRPCQDGGQVQFHVIPLDADFLVCWHYIAAGHCTEDLRGRVHYRLNANGQRVHIKNSLLVCEESTRRNTATKKHTFSGLRDWFRFAARESKNEGARKIAARTVPTAICTGENGTPHQRAYVADFVHSHRVPYQWIGKAVTEINLDGMHAQIRKQARALVLGHACNSLTKELY